MTVVVYPVKWRETIRGWRADRFTEYGAIAAQGDLYLTKDDAIADILQDGDTIETEGEEIIR